MKKYIPMYEEYVTEMSAKIANKFIENVKHVIASHEKQLAHATGPQKIKLQDKIQMLKNKISQYKEHANRYV